TLPRQFGLEFFTNHRILVRILDLVSRPVFHFFADAAQPARRMNRQVSSRRAADVEMLVKPAIRRHEETRLVPWNNDLFSAFRPHDRVSLSGRNDDQKTRAMTVTLFIG